MVFEKLNSAYESVKNGLEAQIALATAEQKEALADTKIALADLKDLMADLKDENRTLRERVQIRESLKPEVGHEWLVRNDDEDITRRYCQVCYYDRDKVIPLNLPTSSIHDRGKRWCPICGHLRG
jgi:rubrerythrin